MRFVTLCLGLFALACSAPPVEAEEEDGDAQTAPAAAAKARAGNTPNTHESVSSDTTGPMAVARAAVVYIQRVNLEEAELGTCTGVLVAPNLVLTARHCVAVLDEAPARCADGEVEAVVNGGAWRGDLPPEGFVVSRSADRPATKAPGAVDAELLACSAIDAGVAEIIDSNATEVCGGNDTAWLVLDRDISLPAYPKIRATPPAVGERVVAFGWGRTSSEGPLTTTLKTMSLEVLAQGDSRYTCTNAEANVKTTLVAPNEIALAPGQFKGDSGGPSFDATGAIAGIHSRQRTASGECNARSVSTTPSVNSEDAIRAFAAAAREARPVPAAPAAGTCQ